MTLRQRLKKIAFLVWISQNLGIAREDLSLRCWGVFCQELVAWLPDLFCFNFLRAGALWLAGSNLPLAGGVVIRKGVFVEVPSHLKLGVGVQINRNTYIGSNAAVEIGSYARLA